MTSFKNQKGKKIKGVFSGAGNPGEIQIHYSDGTNIDCTKQQYQLRTSSGQLLDEGFLMEFLVDKSKAFPLHEEIVRAIHFITMREFGVRTDCKETTLQQMMMSKPIPPLVVLLNDLMEIHLLFDRLGAEVIVLALDC